MSSSPTQLSAFHESGHVVAGVRLGREVSHVALRPGLTTFVTAIPRDIVGLQIYLAGIVAQRISSPGTTHKLSGSDRAEVDRIAWELASHDFDAMEVMIDETALHVSEMLIAEWRTVERVAFRLLTNRPERLDASDVRRIVKPSCRSGQLAVAV